jgi:hypothetical protein
MNKKFVLIILICSVSIFSSCTNKKDEVKFEKNGCFYIYATINDSIEGRFVFDTGADGLYFDSTFLTLHNSIIKSDLDTARMRGSGSTGYKQVLLVKDTVKIAVGKYTHSFTNSPILQLTDINGDNIAGIVGNEFIKNQILIIDNERLVLRIDTAVNSKKYEIAIPFDYIDGRIYLAVDLNMKENLTVTANLLMDLGCSDAIMLNSPYSKSLETRSILPQNRIDYKILTAGALGGSSEGSDFKINSINIGNDIIDNPIICITKDTLGAFSRTDYDGLLGNEILDRYNYAIDYRVQKLYLTKNAKSNTPFKSTLKGFGAIKRNDVAIVNTIYYQSEAYMNGLRLGDSIVSINNKKVRELTEQEFNEEMKAEGKEIKMTLLRNEGLIDISFTLKYLL